MELKQGFIIPHSLEDPVKRTEVPFITIIIWLWIIPHLLAIPQMSLVEQSTTTKLLYLQNHYLELTLLKSLQTYTMQEIFNSAKTYLTSMTWYCLYLTDNTVFLQQLQVHLTLNSTWIFKWHYLVLSTIKMPQLQFQKEYLNMLLIFYQKVFMMSY